MYLAFLFLLANADDLYYEDPQSGLIYDYFLLQAENEYVYETYSFELKFNFAKNVGSDCGKDAAAVAKYSDGSCTAFGFHKDYLVETFQSSEGQKGIIIKYKGEKCSIVKGKRNEIQFTLICSGTEEEFVYIKDEDCKIFLRKKTVLGCGKKIEINWVVFSLVLTFAVFMSLIMLAIVDWWIGEDDQDVEAIQRPIWREMKIIVRKGTKVIFRKNRKNYEDV